MLICAGSGNTLSSWLIYEGASFSDEKIHSLWTPGYLYLLNVYPEILNANAMRSYPLTVGITGVPSWPKSCGSPDISHSTLYHAQTFRIAYGGPPEHVQKFWWIGNFEGSIYCKYRYPTLKSRCSTSAPPWEPRRRISLKSNRPVWFSVPVIASVLSSVWFYAKNHATLLWSV